MPRARQCRGKRALNYAGHLGRTILGPAARLQLIAGIEDDSMLALLFAGDCSADFVMDESFLWFTPTLISTATSRKS